MATVFLTGASGFLGGHLLSELLSAGCEVRALSRRPQSDAAITAQGGVPIRAELADRASLQSAVAGCEAVFHAAADTSMWMPQAPAQTATNIQGTENLLWAAEAVGAHAFVHTSSVPYLVYAISGKRLSTYLQRANVLRAFNRVTGGIFIGFAGLMAIARE